jgi:hypothetical protein
MCIPVSSYGKKNSKLMYQCEKQLQTMAPLFYDQYDLKRNMHKGSLSNHIQNYTPIMRLDVHHEL